MFKIKSRYAIFMNIPFYGLVGNAMQMTSFYTQRRKNSFFKRVYWPYKTINVY